MILIVDDSPDDIELTIIAIKETGREISIRSTTDGESALEVLRNGHELPDLILLDMKMPGMNGTAVLREIRADNCLRDIPVVVVTSSSLESDMTDAVAAGSSGYLKKDFSLDRFSKALDGLLHRWLPN